MKKRGGGACPPRRKVSQIYGLDWEKEQRKVAANEDSANVGQY